jgi:hypothetical protein
MIIAPQYFSGDLERTMSLARLLADIEPDYRSDVQIMFFCQPDTEMTPLVEKTIEHCARRFPVSHVKSKRGDHGHPKACTALWTGAMEYLHEHHPDEAAFMIDGNDGVPLHLDWIDLMLAEHGNTLAHGKLITGTPYWLGGCPLLVNPNAVFQVSALKAEPSLLIPPEYDGTILTHFDIYHRQAMLRQTSLSTVVRTDWHGEFKPICLETMKARASEAIWLHGFKDDNLYWMTRQYLYGNDTVRPVLQRFDLETLYREEAVRNRQQQRR